MNTANLQKQLDIIEQRLLWIAGTLAILEKLNVAPSFAVELKQRLDQSGEAMDAVLVVKKELGLSSQLQKKKGK